MDFYAEGLQQFDKNFSQKNIINALKTGIIMESLALGLDKDKSLHFMLGEYEGIMPYEECALGVSDGTVRDIALITRVGRSVCFLVTAINEDITPKTVSLSRTAVQKRCLNEYLNLLKSGDIIPCRVTHIEPFGAFCDIGCGISALLPIDCMSVSRIHSPCDRLSVGDNIKCVIKKRDEQGRFVLSLKELLGTWQENAAKFNIGDTVVGIVRGVESYGVFVELAPNLAGLAEHDSELTIGQLVSVYIKNISYDKMKIKLIILHKYENNGYMFPIEYYTEQDHIASFKYSSDGARNVIEEYF